MCLAGAVVASWSLTEVVGLSPFTVMTNIFVTEFRENILGKTQMHGNLFSGKLTTFPFRSIHSVVKQTAVTSITDWNFLGDFSTANFVNDRYT